MKIEFTDKAIEKLDRLITNEEKVLKLKYETDGCGCVINGVTELWLVDEKDVHDIVVETNYRPILLDQYKLVFMDENMKIDIVESANCFQLKSPNQILNPRLRYIEK